MGFQFEETGTNEAWLDLDEDHEDAGAFEVSCVVVGFWILSRFSFQFFQLKAAEHCHYDGINGLNRRQMNNRSFAAKVGWKHHLLNKR